VVVGVGADPFVSGMPPEVSPSAVPAVEPAATPSAELEVAEGGLAAGPGTDPAVELEFAGRFEAGASAAAGGAEEPVATAIGGAGIADPCAVGAAASDGGGGVVGALGADPTQAATPSQAPSSVAKGAAIGARIMGFSIFPPPVLKQVAARSKIKRGAPPGSLPATAGPLDVPSRNVPYSKKGSSRGALAPLEHEPRGARGELLLPSNTRGAHLPNRPARDAEIVVFGNAGGLLP
jgi:hypothetical protein